MLRWSVLLTRLGGNEGSEEEGTCQSNIDLSYGAVIAHHYNADFQIIAQGGWGVVHNYGDASAVSDPAIPGVFLRTRFNVAVDDYDPLLFAPQVILIALGINDYGNSADPTQQQFEDGYYAFVQALRSYY